MTVLTIMTMMIRMTMVVYDFVGLDGYEPYHDPHGSDGCGVYCVSRGTVDADVSYSSENMGHDVLRGDVAEPPQECQDTV